MTNLSHKRSINLHGSFCYALNQKDHDELSPLAPTFDKIDGKELLLQAKFDQLVGNENQK